MPKIAIVAALEREVRPLAREWRLNEREYGGRRFRFLENGDCVLVCGGIGAEAARRASEAVIALYAPSVIYSAGFAGALAREMKLGDLFEPRRVVNASDGSSVTLDSSPNLGEHQGERVLISFSSVASPEQKAKLRESYGAQAVDMEAAAVARAAEARGVRFLAIKVISDELDFTFPPLDPFVDSEGRLSETRFAFYVAIRPWLWMQVVQLARNSGRASRTLSAWLMNMTSRQSERSDPTLEPVR